MPATPGASFLSAEVVNLYTHRPPYAAQALARIVTEAPARGRLLDLGCGEGKIARPMSAVFDQVTAVDPSAQMIALGRSLERGQTDNLTWIEATAETAPLTGAYDVVTFASSIHWMDPGLLFAKLRPHLRPDHILAVLAGDEAFEPPWQEDWRSFLAEWVPRASGKALDSAEWRAARTRYLDHVEQIAAEDFVSEPVRQTVESFIQCQHSRDTFARSKLGALGAEFDRELEALLRPHADASGRLSYRVQTRLTLARLPGVRP